MANPVFRFAPSPNGRLHLGHAYSALLNQEMAKDAGGRLLLRIEDIDLARCTPDLEKDIYDDLAWLGIAWEHPVRRQSEHFDDYRRALHALVSGGLAYPAFMSRHDIRAHIAEAEASGSRWPRDPDGAPLYPTDERAMKPREKERRIRNGLPYAWRLDMEKALARFPQGLAWEEHGAGPNGEHGIVTADPARWGDVILARRDVPTSYHLAVVVDDALQAVTHIVRGQDLFHATSVHRLLQGILGLPRPVYTHHRLVLGADGRKLSKSEASTALGALRDAGMRPSDIRAMLGPPTN